MSNPFQYLYSHIKSPWDITKLSSRGDQKLYDALNKLAENSVPQWISPSNSPDGATIVFTFSSPVYFISYNGLMQFPGIGFKSLDNNKYQLINYSGSIITPIKGDIIMGQIS